MNAVRNLMLLGLLVAGPLAAQQRNEAASGLMLETVRLFRGDGKTRVKAFVEVPHRLFTRGTDGKLHYTVEVSVRDSAVGSSRVDLQACKLEYSIVSPK